MAQAVTESPPRDYAFLEDARRKSRFVAALARVRKIAETEPRFTAGQLAELAGVLTDAAAETAGTAGEQEPAA